MGDAIGDCSCAPNGPPIPFCGPMSPFCVPTGPYKCPDETGYGGIYTDEMQALGVPPPKQCGRPVLMNTPIGPKQENKIIIISHDGPEIKQHHNNDKNKRANHKSSDSENRNDAQNAEKSPKNNHNNNKHEASTHKDNHQAAKCEIADSPQVHSSRRDDMRKPGVRRTGRAKSSELRGGYLYRGCDCEKRNGLQDDCRRTGCQGSPECMDIPPTCAPSEFSNCKHLTQLTANYQKKKAVREAEIKRAYAEKIKCNSL